MLKSDAPLLGVSQLDSGEREDKSILKSSAGGLVRIDDQKSK